MVQENGSSIHIFGVRHHGPGSARSLLEALDALQPDVVLVEGPSDGDELIPLVVREGMAPPVAMLLYVPDEPQRAVYYPFAVFSPEWQALNYAVSRGTPVRFMDLPASQMMAAEEQVDAGEEGEESETAQIVGDPLSALAEASGYSDGERWWEHMVEQRRDSRDLFQGILEAMTELRTSVDRPEPKLELQREAHMRQTIRAAMSEGHSKVAVVCGAWHAPALRDLPPASRDAALLKGMPKVKIRATWVPWTYGRLSYHSGYGAGVESPGWYQYLWESRDQVAIRWMTQVARLLRDEDLDASSAHVIEAVRLAECLAALRERPLPGLAEMNEAVQTVFCFGGDAPMRLIHEKLIVGERLGSVPADAPSVALQADIAREQKRLRLPAEATQRVLDLDLRKPNDLDRSLLLHRLDLLGIPWGAAEEVSGKSGTFHEIWRIQWRPEFAVSIIEASCWGNTAREAASARVCGLADKATSLPELTGLLDRALLAEIPDAVTHLMERIGSISALTSDVNHLMDALPPLVNVLRYGNVRKTDTGAVSEVVDGLVTRICIGLPGGCSSLNDDAAADMLRRLSEVNSSVVLLQNDEYTEAWHRTLKMLSGQQGLHGLVAGRSVRILLDAGVLPADEVAVMVSLALSRAVDPSQSAAWVEGFLQGSGLLLLHDDALWSIIDGWVSGLQGGTFTDLLPLLRRTFSSFPAPERRQMGERTKRKVGVMARATPRGVDAERGELVLPLVAQILGLSAPARG